MGRSRNLHLHEIFYFKERALAGLYRAEPLVANLEQQEEGLQALLPILHRITELEVRLAFLLQQKAEQPVVLTRESPECLELEALQKSLVAWSEAHVSSSMWRKLQGTMRQKRRRSTPVWLLTLRKILYPEQFEERPRWHHPLKDRDPFAARLLVPARSSTTRQQGALAAKNTRSGQTRQ